MAGRPWPTGRADRRPRRRWPAPGRPAVPSPMQPTVPVGGPAAPFLVGGDSVATGEGELPAAGVRPGEAGPAAGMRRGAAGPAAGVWPGASAANCASVRPRRTSTPCGAGSGPWEQPREAPVRLFTSNAPSQAEPVLPEAADRRTPAPGTERARPSRPAGRQRTPWRPAFPPVGAWGPPRRRNWPRPRRRRPGTLISVRRIEPLRGCRSPAHPCAVARQNRSPRAAVSTGPAAPCPGSGTMGQRARLAPNTRLDRVRPGRFCANR